MDETTIASEAPDHGDGFVGQRLCVVPRPQITAAMADPAMRQLVVTDAGYFPVAAGHRRHRDQGATESIVILCVSGAGTVRVGGEAHALTASACVMIPAGEPHEYEASNDDPWTIWWVHVRGNAVPALIGPLVGSPRPLSRLRSIDREVALFDEIVSLLERRLSPAHLLAASGAAWHLLTRIAADSVLPAEGSPLERAIRYLEARADSSIRVAELARLVGLSPSHLSALFRQATGQGPAAFHTGLRMARARDLLDTTSMSVSQVAATVGYADPLYFSRHFARIHGSSPTRYRAQRKG